MDHKNDTNEPVVQIYMRLRKRIAGARMRYPYGIDVLCLHVSPWCCLSELEELVRCVKPLYVSILHVPSDCMWGNNDQVAETYYTEV